MSKGNPFAGAVPLMNQQQKEAVQKEQFAALTLQFFMHLSTSQFTFAMKELTEERDKWKTVWDKVEEAKRPSEGEEGGPPCALNFNPEGSLEIAQQLATVFLNWARTL